MVDTLDPAALDAFTHDLRVNGFEPASPDLWIGPAPALLSTLTAAQVITIRLYDGWPYRVPAVFVDGLPIGRHRNSSGHMCLWESGDPSLEWLTLDGIKARIELWATEAQGDATAQDPGLDPHLVLRGIDAGLATIDLTNRVIAGPAMDDLLATEKDNVLSIGAEGDVRGRWYVVDPAPQLPQHLTELDPYLTEEQRADFVRVRAEVGQPDAAYFVVFAWPTPVGPNLLIVRLVRSGTDLEVRPYEAARTDTEILLMRAGSDAPVLRNKKVVIFGVGAVGSHVDDLLARSGVGELTVADYQRLRPGDIVRHSAIRFMVGSSKVDAVKLMNEVAAPWTTTVKLERSYWGPTVIGDIIAMADVVVDATGLSNFTAQLGEVCRERQRPMVSVALYRRGFVGRVRYQAAEPEIAILDRPTQARFPVIPAGADEEGASWEAGCMAAVAEAPPTSVVAIAATAARVVIDALTGRDIEDRDVLEVYRPLEAAPFDAIGLTVIR